MESLAGRGFTVANTTKLSVSLVVYKTSPCELRSLFLALSKIPNPTTICIVDNYGDPALAAACHEFGFQLFPSQTNLGFGYGHNAAFVALENSGAEYHLIVNPDTRFDPADLPGLLDYMGQNPDIGIAMPDIRNPDGSRQHLCKLVPTPFDLLARRFFPASKWKTSHEERYELRHWAHDKVANIPVLSGCFMLIRSCAFKQARGFDKRFFMYMEDVDLCRRIGQKWRLVFYPFMKVEHGYAKGSYRNKRLLMYHIRSAIQYFNKWGWFFDADRLRRNKRCLHELGLKGKSD